MAERCEEINHIKRVATGSSNQGRATGCATTTGRGLTSSLAWSFTEIAFHDAFSKLTQSAKVDFAHSRFRRLRAPTRFLKSSRFESSHSECLLDMTVPGRCAVLPLVERGVGQPAAIISSTHQQYRDRDRDALDSSFASFRHHSMARQQRQ